MGLKILIVGAGICGPALSSLLLRSRQGHRITIIERSRDIRVAGAQIDLKCQAVPIVKRMGLMGAVKRYAVQETGLEIVNSRDESLMTLGVSPADQRLFTLTSEFEIMRGDLVRILHNESIEQARLASAGSENNGTLSYRFNTTITILYQQLKGVQVSFSDGTTEEFDLVVAADGQRSRTRRLAFGTTVDETAFQSLSIHAAYFTIPRARNEGGLARMCLEPGKFLLTRTSNRPVTGLNIFVIPDDKEIKESYGKSIAVQKAAWAMSMQHSHWQADRFRTGLRDCQDFYAHEQGQVKMSKLSIGRVVLLGDAGYCPSPFTGQGTTLALGGAYILAGELARSVGDVDKALEAYESALRPLINECQQLSPGGPQAFFPKSALTVKLLQAALWAMSLLRLDKLISRWLATNTSAASAWNPNDYAELNLECT